MTSMANETHASISIEMVTEQVKHHHKEVFGPKLMPIQFTELLEH